MTTTCPVCGSGSLPIVYGLPGYELMEAAERGEVALGGCLVWDEQPDRRCTNQDCRSSFSSASGLVVTEAPWD